jgi:excisionase family DNA binding protein
MSHGHTSTTSAGTSATPSTGVGGIVWLSTGEAADRLGVTPRTLYRFIDEGQLPAYRFGRVIRLQQGEVDAYIQRCRIQPGELEHLYPEVATTSSDRA